MIGGAWERVGVSFRRRWGVSGGGFPPGVQGEWTGSGIVPGRFGGCESACREGQGAYSDGSQKGRQSMNFRVVGGRWAWLFITRPTER